MYFGLLECSYEKTLDHIKTTRVPTLLEIVVEFLRMKQLIIISLSRFAPRSPPEISARVLFHSSNSMLNIRQPRLSSIDYMVYVAQQK